MEIVEVLSDIEKIKNNKIIIEGNLILKNSKIIFHGKENRLVVFGKVILENSVLEYKNDRSLIFLNDDPWHPYKMRLRIHNECVLYCGKNIYFNDVVRMSIDEMTNVFIGDDCLFSFGIWIRTGDPHVIYSTTTHKRLNCSKSVFVGDHIWMGQNSLLLKGTHIGSGSIIGANSVVSKKIPSNQIWAGNPAKKVKENVFYINKAVHEWDNEMKEKYDSWPGDEFIFEYDDSETLDYKEIDNSLMSLEIEDKVRFLESISKVKNRFFI